MMDIKVGDRVRVKPQAGWPIPPGYRFEGAEGTVVKWVQYDDAMADFKDFVICLKMDTGKGEAAEYVGSTLLFRVQDVEPV